MIVRRYSRAEQGLVGFKNFFGSLGGVQRVNLHHSAGPRATSKAEAIRLNLQYHADHARKGWGGYGYHLTMDDYGRLYDARFQSWKGAHTALDNTGSFGVMIHGDYTKDKLNWRQRRTLRGLYRGQIPGFRRLGTVPWFGHCERPDQATACPGENILSHLRWLRSRGR